MRRRLDACLGDLIEFCMSSDSLLKLLGTSPALSEEFKGSTDVQLRLIARKLYLWAYSFVLTRADRNSGISFDAKLLPVVLILNFVEQSSGCAIKPTILTGEKGGSWSVMVGSLSAIKNKFTKF